MDRVTLKNLVYKVNGAAIEVHKSLGPGLLESVYHRCLKHELTIREVGFKSEMLVPVYYKDLLIETELYCDLFIEGYLVVELKAIEKVLPIHEAQLLTYMKLLDAPMGLMINFNCLNIYEAGQKTYVNELYRYLH
nr:GxxExxY protein [Pedobacter sp. ASV2]